MKYEVRCECGKAHAVSGADAGATLNCACGQRVEVPPFHQLRSQAGQSAVPILAQVRGLIATGLLPGPRVCVCCRRPAKGVMQVGIGCETTPGSDRSGGDAAGCLLGWLTGGPAGLLLGAGTARMVKKASPDVSIVVPLPVCDACRPSHNDPATLRLSLRQFPEYAALLDQYPNARIVLR
jgi:hypothetical protein